MLTSSVILATYNGEKYIRDQIESMIAQDLQPDEVIIIDDNSHDATPQIINDYIREKDLYRWRMMRNESNLGWKENFFRGIEQAGCDVIFPCDQDDIWHKDKISSMMRIMESDDRISVLEGKPHKFFDRDNSVQNNTVDLRKAVGIYLDRRRAKKELCKNTKSVRAKEFDIGFFRRPPACTLAFRKKVFDDLKHLWFEEMPHDALMTYFPLVKGEYYEYDYEIIEWRQHVDSASKPIQRNRNNRIAEIKNERRMLKILLRFAMDNSADSKSISIIREAIKWNEARYLLVEQRQAKEIIDVIKYNRYYLQKRKLLTDIKYGIMG